jgi:hypothetical protein
MLENLLNLIKENAGDAVINNPAIPNENNDAVISAAGQSITGGLQNLISQGNVQELMNLFHSNTGEINANPVVQNISGDFVNNLMSRFGLNQAAANGVAGILIPTVLQKLVGKTNDPNDSSFSLEGIMSHLGGAKGIEGLLGSFTGGQSTAGVMDKIKGLFA